MKAAVLANPRARGMRRGAILAAVERELAGRAPVFVPDGLASLRRRAQSLADEGVALIAVIGGDGTLGRTMTEIVRAWPQGQLPGIVPLAGGTMNTISRTLGCRGGPRVLAHAFARHLDGGRALVPVTRWVLDVDGTRNGFLFGNGLFARYIEAYEHGEPGPGRAAAVLARATGSAMVGGPFAAALTRPVSARLEVDGELLAEGEWLVASAGTIEQVGLGFRPFEGAARQPGSLHALGIGCSPFELALQLHRPFRGLPFDHRHIVERVGTELVIRAQEPQLYMMDGDLTQGGPTVSVRVGPAVMFWVPDAPRAFDSSPHRLADAASSQAVDDRGNDR